MTKEQRQYNGAKIVSSSNGAGTSRPVCVLDTDRPFFTVINSKWITDLDVKCETIKLLEDNIGENLEDLRWSSDFSATTPKA